MVPDCADDILLYREVGDNGYEWFVDDVDGKNRISVSFKQVGWGLIDYPQVHMDDEITDFYIDVRNQRYCLGKERGFLQSIVEVVDRDQPLSLRNPQVAELSIPKGHPAIHFFTKKGHDLNGVERVESITHSFNRQRY